VNPREWALGLRVWAELRQALQRQELRALRLPVSEGLKFRPAEKAGWELFLFRTEPNRKEWISRRPELRGDPPSA